jgi:hypothetical protein
VGTDSTGGNIFGSFINELKQKVEFLFDNINLLFLFANPARHKKAAAFIKCVIVTIINALGFVVLEAKQTSFLEFHSEPVPVLKVTRILHPRTSEACAGRATAH